MQHRSTNYQFVTADSPPRRNEIAIPGANVEILFNVLGPQWATSALQELEETSLWKEATINIFGRKVISPRLSAWHGDKSYTYSKLTWPSLPWTRPLIRIKERVEKISDSQFNGVLLNLYRHGRDSMGWHSDNEPELGALPTIASLSLGAERRFLFRCRNNPAIKHAISLPHDSLLIMAGKTQVHWQHSLPKTAKFPGPRLNLSFRWING